MEFTRRRIHHHQAPAPQTHGVNSRPIPLAIVALVPRAIRVSRPQHLANRRKPQQAPRACASTASIPSPTGKATRRQPPRQPLPHRPAAFLLRFCPANAPGPPRRHRGPHSPARTPAHAPARRSASRPEPCARPSPPSETSAAARQTAPPAAPSPPPPRPSSHASKIRPGRLARLKHVCLLSATPNR